MTQLYNYLEDKIKKTRFILELLDLGYDIANSKLLTKSEINQLCNAITDKINIKMKTDKMPTCFGTMDTHKHDPNKCLRCSDYTKLRCFNLSFYNNENGLT